MLALDPFRNSLLSENGLAKTIGISGANPSSEDVDTVAVLRESICAGHHEDV
jgi:hypothetical protein